jgi:hypothetical protein
MKTIYKCDGCGQQFEDWNKCLDHEQEHLKIKSSQLIFNLGDINPHTLKITFNDDSSGIYDLFGTIQAPQKESPLLQTEN